MSNLTEDDDYIYDYDLDESLSTYDWAELGPSLFIYSLTFLAGIIGKCVTTNCKCVLCMYSDHCLMWPLDNAAIRLLWPL